jgi:hypothetical protein
MDDETKIEIRFTCPICAGTIRKALIAPTGADHMWDCQECKGAAVIRLAPTGLFEFVFLPAQAKRAKEKPTLTLIQGGIEASDD